MYGTDYVVVNSVVVFVTWSFEELGGLFSSIVCLFYAFVVL